jgi:hypothetical protein
MADGFVSRAATALSQTGALDLEQRPNAIETLRSLHPPGPSQSELPRLPDDSPYIALEPDESLRKQIKNLANGSAPGPSGWTGSMLTVVAKDTTCLQGIAALCTDMISGRFDQRSREYLVSSILLGIPKPANPNAVRPLAIGELFYRLAATLCERCQQGRRRTSSNGPVFQLGVGVDGGPELAVKKLDTILCADVPLAGYAADCRNAFNSLDRAHALRQLFMHVELASLWRFAHWAYGVPSNLLIRGSSGIVIDESLRSSQGVRQGDPLGSLLFAVAVHPVYQQALQRTAKYSRDRYTR